MIGNLNLNQPPQPIESDNGADAVGADRKQMTCAFVSRRARATRLSHGVSAKPLAGH
jgi:hypothetical protein